MKTVITSFLLLICVAVSPATADLITGVATGSTPTIAIGSVNGVNWVATTTTTSPFLGVNMGSGHWDLDFPLEQHGLFLGTGNVNGGESQHFLFQTPVTDLVFFIENFDSSSVANISTDANLSILTATPNVSLTSTSANTGVLTSSSALYDGVGDAVLHLSGPTSFIQIDYTMGEGDNGIFYGFAQQTSTTSISAVPEPSSFLFLGLCGSGVAWVRRRRKLAL